jgi:hypothetical protein
VTGKSRGRRWERVIAARQQARAALDRDPNARDLYDTPPKRATMEAPPLPTWNAERPPERPDESVRVLTFQEAATRLGISRAELEVMVARGQVESLPTNFVAVIPTREVERLKRGD